MRQKLFVLLFSVFLLGCGERQEVVGYVLVSVDQAGDITVGFDSENIVTVNHVSKHAKTVFPESSTSTVEMIDEYKFTGLELEGDGQVVQISACKIPNEPKVRVICDTTLPLVINIVMEGGDGDSPGGDYKVNPGEHDIILDI